MYCYSVAEVIDDDHIAYLSDESYFYIILENFRRICHNNSVDKEFVILCQYKEDEDPEELLIKVKDIPYNSRLLAWSEYSEWLPFYYCADLLNLFRELCDNINSVALIDGMLYVLENDSPQLLNYHNLYGYVYKEVSREYSELKLELTKQVMEKAVTNTISIIKMLLGNKIGGYLDTWKEKEKVGYIKNLFISFSDDEKNHITVTSRDNMPYIEMLVSNKLIVNWIY